jgi:hypothetical protein
MSERPGPPSDSLAAYRDEVLRWNRQINLISRQDSGQQLDELIEQCRRAFAAVFAAEAAALRGSVLYCDLGAGGGLPGFVWHERLLRDAGRVESWLVEPREKRAWFLERVARLAGPPAYGVLRGRWGEVKAGSDQPVDVALVSLKALFLSDLEVLEGLAKLRADPATLPARVVIARFHPPGTEWSDALARRLGWAGVGRAAGPWQGASAEALAVAGARGSTASIVVSRYVSRAS